MSQLFEPQTIEETPMGERGRNGRYRLPPLPGEAVVKSGAGHISGGAQSMTNLASSISDTKALGDWKLEQFAIGLGMHPEAVQALRNGVYGAQAQGVDMQALKDSDAGLQLRALLAEIAEQAWDIGGANAARDAGIVRHDVWEAYGKSHGVDLRGTDEINAEIRCVRELLDAAGFEIVPELCERTVRNLAVQAAGRFDNILLHRPTGSLLMADLKTKRKPFWSMLEIDAQLAGYAYSEVMLEWITEEWSEDGQPIIRYVDGPKPLGVDLTVGVVLHMPSDGSEPRLRKADLVQGWETMQLARRVCTQRSAGKSAARMADSYWEVS